MNALVQNNQMAEHFSEFFTPVKPDLLASLVKQRDSKLAMILRLKETMENEKIRTAMSYFLGADKRAAERNGGAYHSVGSAYDVEAAQAGLDAEFWEKALSLTDVYDHMPQDRRSEWREMINGCTAPPFEADTVYNTIKAQLDARARYLAERVDGMFRNLSGEHVTNSPSGFNKRMIIARMVDDMGFPNWDRCGYVDDLRKVIAKFMNRETPRFGDTRDTLRAMTSDYGQWFDWDGGALKARLYKKGTVHLEVHPDVAWRLNEILAYLYPSAISDGSLKPPKRPRKEFGYINRPLPSNIIHALHESTVRWSGTGPIELSVRGEGGVKGLLKEMLSALGATPTKVPRKFDRFGETYMMDAMEFDYDAKSVIAHVITSGCLPDKKSYQFYPTPPDLAEEAIAWADIDDDHLVLEPSAGQGGIAELLPDAANVTCAELSPLHCKVLESKGFKTEQGDFLDKKDGFGSFDRVVMNPPFADGRAVAHVEHAVNFLKPGGVLLAIVPSSVRNTELRSNCTITSECSEVLSDRFSDAAVNVVLLRVERAT